MSLTGAGSSDARVPIYYEEVEEDREESIKKAQEIGFRLNWDYFTGMTTYFPSIIHTELPPDSEYDLFVVSQRDPLMTYRFTAHNPYIDDAAVAQPLHSQHRHERGNCEEKRNQRRGHYLA